MYAIRSYYAPKRGKDGRIEAAREGTAPGGKSRVGRQAVPGQAASTAAAAEKPVEGVAFGNDFFEITRVKGKKQLTLPLDRFTAALKGADLSGSLMKQIAGLRGKIQIGSHDLLSYNFV